MKTDNIILAAVFVLTLGSCNPVSTKKQTAGNAAVENQTPADESATSLKPQLLTKTDFLEKVYDFEKNPKSWSFRGEKPCMIDFYADWCGPCKRIAPILDDLSAKYAGKVTIYRVNVDEQRELAGFFRISNIPTVLYCPVNGQPQITMGALPKEKFEQIINEFLLAGTSLKNENQAPGQKSSD
jgi:thioredoxin 1